MSTAKGTSFEIEVYEDIKSDLSRFGLNPNLCKLFLHKAYHSKDRGASITVDISIEVYAEGQTEPSVIWIWECKDLSRPVTIEDFEKLHSVLEQIGPDNTKGTLVARGAFTKGARKYAESKKLGYARYYGRTILANPCGGWPQEWIDSLQHDFELVLSDENGEYESCRRIVGRRFFGRHGFGGYDYTGDLGEFIGYEILRDAAFRLARQFREEERERTPRWRIAMKIRYNRIHLLIRNLWSWGSRRFERKPAHTGPREVKVKRIF